MGKGMTAKKAKGKNKRIMLTQAQAQAKADELYWKILRMFLAAAMDVYDWKEQEVVDFAARVNWYFDAANTEHTISEELVDKIIEENMGLIMTRKQEQKERTE